MSRVGIYGGTFDPIHRGHLHVITQLFEKDLIDQLLLVPAGQPLLRVLVPTASAEQRRRMCELAVSELPEDIKNKVQVNPIEILRQGPSYAIDTVEAVISTFPDDQIYLILGADAFSIELWLYPTASFGRPLNKFFENTNEAAQVIKDHFNNFIKKIELYYNKKSTEVGIINHNQPIANNDQNFTIRFKFFVFIMKPIKIGFS